MKLFAWTSGAVGVAGLLCGCSSAPRVAQSPASQSEATGTTQLRSAQLPAPPPKVGKSHLAMDVDPGAHADATDGSDALKLGAPGKEGRRSDGTRRGGHFGTTK